MGGRFYSTFWNHAGWFLVTLAVFVLAVICIACGGGGSSIGSVQNPPAAPDALGSVVAVTQLPCSQLLGADGGAQSGTCYQATVACPGVSDEDVAVKVNAPAGSSLGTVSLQVGGGGTPWYDQHFVYGTKLVNDLNVAGFTAVQFNWGFLPVGFPQGGTFAGWLTGPGGPRKLACRFATIEKWVHDNTSIHAASSAFCHSGNSAGSGVGAYALAHYGLGSILNYVEETSGPPFAQIDQGCICNSPPVQTPCNPQPLNTCYGTDGNDYIDPAYDPTTHICSSVEANHSTANKSMFINDSLLSSDATLSYPNTVVHFVFGGQDTGSAVSQAVLWKNAITAKGGAPAVSCVPSAGHRIPDDPAGEQQIASDLIAGCHQ